MGCIACGAQETKRMYDILTLCPACQFAWADSQYSDEEWKKIYGKDYFFGEEYVDYLKEEKALRKNFQRDLDWIKTFSSGGKLLEIGCAYGFFLDEAQKYFDVRGMDIHAQGCAYAREQFGLKTESGDFLRSSYLQESFDAVVMWDVLEHLPAPHLYLAKAAQMLKKNGYIFLSTLDRTSPTARLSGKNWRQIHPPTHLSYFSWESLKLMLHSAGFKVKARKYRGSYRSWNNTFYNLFVLRWKKPEWYEGLKSVFQNDYYYLNTFDHVYVAAIKQ